MPTAQQKLSQEEVSLVAKVERAIQSSIKEEIEILKNGRVERNFTSCLAATIQKEVNKENIRGDAFYNKHLGASKCLGDRQIELDIAVHERNTDTNNLIAIELETNNRPVGDDIWKIEGLTQDLYGYGYKLGLYLVVGISERAGQIITMDWYRDGNKIEI